MLIVSLDPPSLTLLADERPLMQTAAPFLFAGRLPTARSNYYFDPFLLPDAPFGYPRDIAFPAFDTVVSVTQRAGGAELGLQGPDGLVGTLDVAVQRAGTFRLRLTTDDPRIVTTRILLAAPEGENYYGLGEQMDHVAHRGLRRAMQFEIDGEQESGYNEVHVPVPLLVATTGWGLFVEDRHPGCFDVAATDAAHITVDFATGDLTFYALAARDPLDVTARYAAITGLPAVPAPWAFGGIQWRNEVDDAAMVLADAEAMRAHDFPMSGIWIDRPYADAVSTHRWHETRFPDAADLVARLNALGFRVAVWSAPCLEPRSGELYATAEANGYFVRTPPGWPRPFENCALMDLTNPAAADFWKSEVLSHAVAAGIEGYKLDYGEDVQIGLFGVPLDFGFANGESALTMHKGYALYYHQPYADVLPPDGGFILSRAGTYGDQTLTTTIWPGDLCNDFYYFHETANDETHVGGLPATIVAGTSLGPSGYPFFAGDTGGYRHGRPSKEVLIRWQQYAALLPVLQLGGGGVNHNPWDFEDHGANTPRYDAETLDICRDYARLHLQLFPYHYSYARVAGDTGRPPVRPFGLAYPDDGRHPDFVFQDGDWLLVAPVHRAGGQVEVPLPAGRFVDFFAGTVHEGPTTLDLDVPLDRLPLYLRAGAIVPMLDPDIDTLSPASDPTVDSFAVRPGALHVRLLPAGETAFMLWEGTTVSQDDGPPLRVGLQSGGTFDGWQLDVDWTNRASAPASPPVAVEVDGTPLGPLAAAPADDTPGWFFDAGRGRLLVRLAAGDHTLVLQ